MKKSVFILLCMLCSSFIFCTAQQLDMQHNMFRSGDVIKKVLCTLTEESTDCKETKLWTIHGKDDDMSVLQKFYQSNDSLRNIYFSERNALNHFSLENNVLKLSVKEDNQTYIRYDLREPILMFPFSYGDRISGMFHGTGTFCDKLRMRSCGSYSLCADEQGSLVTIDGDTLHNVMCLHALRYENVSYFPREQVPSNYGVFTDDSIRACISSDTLVLQEDFCRWYAPGYRYPVAERCRYSYSGQVIAEYSLFCPLEEQENLDLDEANIEIRQKVKDGTYVPYRNPSNVNSDNIMDYHCSMDDSGRNIHVEFTVNSPASVSFVLSNSEGMAFRSFSGNYQPGENHSVDISCAGLPRGQYVLYLNANGSVSSEKFKIQ